MMRILLFSHVLVVWAQVNAHSETPRRPQNVKGWASYFENEISSFLDVPLEWALNTEVPHWLLGSYIKNGPGKSVFEDGRYYENWLDGCGKIHKLTFVNGTGKFSGRMIETGNYNKSVARKAMVPSVTLDKVRPADWSIYELFEGLLNGYDNTNVLLWKLGPPEKEKGMYIATTDYPLVHEIDPDTLRVKQAIPFTDVASMASCSHWKREVGKSTSLNFHVVFNFLRLQYDFILYRFGNSMKDYEVIGKFPCPHLPTVHMISNTENYAVIILYPVSMDLGQMYKENMHPIRGMTPVEGPTRIYIMDLRDGHVISGIESNDPGISYSTHHVNAWEEGDEIVINYVSNRWSNMPDYLNIKNIMSEDKGNIVPTFLMKRARINLKTKDVSVHDWENALEIPYINYLEFPNINTNYNGIRNRFVYGWIGIDNQRQGLVKKDLEDSINDKVWSVPFHYPGEPFFVANTEGKDEDDGIVLSIVYDGTFKKSYILLLDGKTFDVINFAYLPYRVPYSFHGNWFSELY